MDLDNRKYIRSKLSADVRITPEGSVPMDAVIVDLSLHGMLVQAEKMLQAGQQCQILMRLGNGKHKLPINASGRIIRVQDKYIAIQFHAVGLGEYEELESSILVHSDDPEECIKEFALSAFVFDPLSASSLEPYPEPIAQTDD